MITSLNTNRLGGLALASLTDVALVSVLNAVTTKPLARGYGALCKVHWRHVLGVLLHICLVCIDDRPD